MARRQRLEQLYWAGQQFAQAIGSYYESSPGGAMAYPKTLENLLEDRRYPFVRRHLRRVYMNPFTGAADWELVKAPDGGIQGVRVGFSWGAMPLPVQDSSSMCRARGE